MVCTVEKPWVSAASNCPLGMAFRPPRMISAMMEDSNSTSATTARKRIFISTLVRPHIFLAKKRGQGQATRQIKIHSSSGVLRKISM